MSSETQSRAGAEAKLSLGAWRADRQLAALSWLHVLPGFSTKCPDVRRSVAAGALPPEFPLDPAGSAAFARGSERKLSLDAARAGISTEALGWLHALTGPGAAAGTSGAAQVWAALLRRCIFFFSYISARN